MVLKLSLSGRKLLVLITFTILSMAASDLGCEQLTLSTYYPIPYGVYKKIWVRQYAEFGVDGKRVVVGDLTNHPAGGAGIKGVYAENGDLVLGSNNKVVRIGSDSTLLDKMCSWKAYSSPSIDSGFCSSLGAGFIPLAIANSSYEHPYISARTKSAWDIRTGPEALVVLNMKYFPPIGNVLCCKFGIYTPP